MSHELSNANNNLAIANQKVVYFESLSNEEKESNSRMRQKLNEL